MSDRSAGRKWFRLATLSDLVSAQQGQEPSPDNEWSGSDSNRRLHACEEIRSKRCTGVRKTRQARAKDAQLCALFERVILSEHLGTYKGGTPYKGGSQC